MPFGALAALAVVVCGCAPTADHSWKGEFDARLDGAKAVVEEAEQEGNPGQAEQEGNSRRPTREYLANTYRLGLRLEHDYLLIDELSSPTSCEAVEVKGKDAVRGDAVLLVDLLENLTPRLKYHLVEILEDEVATIEKREREAETCA